jgi:putative glutamine transport system substrate-binding protein
MKKNVKKTTLITFSLIVAFAAVFTGCGNNTATSGKADKADKVEKNSGVLAQIKTRDKLVAGVKYDQYLFGQKDTATGKVEGFDVDLMKALAKDLLGDENKLELKEASSKTRVDLLKKGDIDIIAASMTITPERAKQMDFSNPYFKTGQILMVPANSPIKDLKDIDQAGKIVVTAKGSVVGEVMKEKAPKATVKEYENFAEALTALKNGKGDALMTFNSIIYGMILQSKDNGKDTFKMTGEQLTVEEVGFGINKGNEDFNKYVNDWLDKIKKDGTYDAIYKKWFGNEKF